MGWNLLNGKKWPPESDSITNDDSIFDDNDSIFDDNDSIFDDDDSIFDDDDDSIIDEDEEDEDDAEDEEDEKENDDDDDDDDDEIVWEGAKEQSLDMLRVQNQEWSGSERAEEILQSRRKRPVRFRDGFKWVTEQSETSPAKEGDGSKADNGNVADKIDRPLWKTSNLHNKASKEHLEKQKTNFCHAKGCIWTHSRLDWNLSKAKLGMRNESLLESRSSERENNLFSNKMKGSRGLCQVAHSCTRYSAK